MDEEIFKRGQLRGFALSQRFKHICSCYSSTLKAAGQIITTNVILRAMPRSIAHGLLLSFICFIFARCFLIVFELTGKKKRKRKDADIIAAINSQSHKTVVDGIGNEGVVVIISYILIVSTLMAVFRDRMNSFVGLLYCVLVLLALFYLIKYLFKRPSTVRFNNSPSS